MTRRVSQRLVNFITLRDGSQRAIVLIHSELSVIFVFVYFVARNYYFYTCYGICILGVHLSVCEKILDRFNEIYFRRNELAIPS